MNQSQSKRTLQLAALLLGMGAAMPTQAAVNESLNHPDSVYVFAYTNQHRHDAGEGLRFAYSGDMKTWQSVVDGYSFVKSDFGAWGANKKMFAPSVARGANGRWYAVWVVNDHSNQFATTWSDDLYLWKPQDYPFIQKGESIERIALSILKDGRFQVTYKTRSGKTYKTLSSDFKTWGEPQPADDFQDRYQRFVIDGEQREGEIVGCPMGCCPKKVEWSVVSNLLVSAQAARFRADRNRENMRGDQDRFGRLKDIEVKLQVNQDNSKRISDKLMGIFFEDISRAADGGLYAELLQNRDFEFSSADQGEWNAQTGWTLDGKGLDWSIATDDPISENNKHYVVLSVSQPGGKLLNVGNDGICLRKGEKYDLSLFLRSLDGGKQAVKVSLLDAGKELATVVVSSSTAWKKQTAQLRPSADADNATLAIEPIESGKIAVDFVSLFPNDTFRGHKNGLRKDLAQVIADLHPRFMRFPGGCATHGNGIDNIYRWKNTIGPLHERKQDFNIWGYHQSMGLGFYEYFLFCEDIGAEPLPVLAAGVPCQNSSRGGDGQQGGIPMDQMDEYLQELLDLIDWANGDPKTSEWARKRAEAGHPKPFNLKFIGIGNEDLISDVFEERYRYLCEGIHQKYPDITIVGTVGPFFEGSDYEFGWRLAKDMKLPIVDEHYYNSPGWFINNQDFYDNYERNSTKVYLGEYASQGNNLENALAEAIFLTNVERNGDVVEMTSYAPLLAKEGRTNWNPDMIYFNNKDIHPTVNYEVQKLFGNNSGSLYLDNSLSATAEGRALQADARQRLGSSVVKDEKTGDIIVKLCNLLPVEAKTEVSLGSLKGYSGKAVQTVLQGNPFERDQRPTTESITVGENFTYTMPAYSFTVVRMKKGK